jgi:hypothetical protein
LNKVNPSPALFGLAPVMLVDQKILQRPQQKRSEATTTGIGQRKQIAFKHHKKKILGQILGVHDGVTAPTNESENWPPIDLAQFAKGLARRFLRASGVCAG